jgi:hypothetical protein
MQHSFQGICNVRTENIQGSYSSIIKAYKDLDHSTSLLEINEQWSIIKSRDRKCKTIKLGSTICINFLTAALELNNLLNKECLPTYVTARKQSLPLD